MTVHIADLNAKYEQWFLLSLGVLLDLQPFAASQ